MAVSFKTVFYVVCLGCSQFIYAVDDLCPLFSHDCSQNGVLCSIVRDQDCIISDNMKHTEPHYPGPVTGFEVKTYYLPPSQPPYSKSRVEMSWRLQHNDTHRYLRGFEVRLTQETGVPQCFIFNFTDPKWLINTGYKYILNCTYLSNSGYTVEVTSLPKSPTTIQTSTLIQIVNKHKDENPDDCDPLTLLCWDTDIVAYEDLCKDQIRVSFTRAPAELAISKYEISLIHGIMPDAHTGLIPSAGDHFVHGTIDTSNLDLTTPLRERRIYVIPHCTDCRSSKTMEFALQKPSKENCTFIPTHPGPALSKWQLILCITLVVTLAAAIAIIIVLCSQKRISLARLTNLVKGSTDSVEGQSVYNSESRSTCPLLGPKRGVKIEPKNNKPTKARKSVYLMYSIDNQAHWNVVGCLKSYLEMNCCDVIFDITEHNASDMRTYYEEEWIRKKMDSCDHILIINSEGAYNKADAFCNGCTYDDVDSQYSYMGDMFTPAYSILQTDLEYEQSSIETKLIFAHFDYTGNAYVCLPDCNMENKANYKLMDNIEQICAHIDGFNQDMGYHNDFKYQEARGGQQLALAIASAKSYVEVNPGWLVHMYEQAKQNVPEVHLSPNFPEYRQQDHARDPCQIDVFQTTLHPGSLTSSEKPSSNKTHAKMSTITFSPPKPVDDTSTLGGSVGDEVDLINNEDSGYGMSRNSWIQNKDIKRPDFHNLATQNA